MDLTGYKLVFEDNFDGDTLDLTKWEHRGSGPRDNGFMAPSAVRVENGNLILRYDYRNGEYGEGWYMGMIRARQRFVRGYFEMRCICSEPTPGTTPHGPWSAFWLQSEHSYNAEHSRGGIGGAEIDIFEAMTKMYCPGVCSHIYCRGKKNSAVGPDRNDDCMVGGMFIPDCYTAYHTYALEWTEDRYRFLVDGFCYAESNWGDGVSEAPEELIVSMHRDFAGDHPRDFVREFVIDYVKVWQK